MDIYSDHDCNKYSLGITCRCLEFKNIVDNFKAFNVGTLNTAVQRLESEGPIACAKVFWRDNRMEIGREIARPVLDLPQITDNIKVIDIEKMWIPISPDLVSFKHMDV